jgi:molybdenum cofactor cytidylyltransferase
LKTVGILLAAGQSRRFGVANKLLAPLTGKPLVMHAAETMLQLDLTHNVAVVAAADVADQLTGFEIVRVDGGQRDMAQNIAAGVRLAVNHDADQILIALGDMPFVPQSHFEALLHRNQGDEATASSDGNVLMPPACFSKRYFAQLLSLSGDQGAAQIIKALPARSIIIATHQELRDVDFPGDIDQCEIGG